MIKHISTSLCVCPCSVRNSIFERFPKLSLLLEGCGTCFLSSAARRVDSEGFHSAGMMRIENNHWWALHWLSAPKNGWSVFFVFWFRPKNKKQRKTQKQTAQDNIEKARRTAKNKIKIESKRKTKTRKKNTPTVCWRTKSIENHIVIATERIKLLHNDAN